MKITIATSIKYGNYKHLQQCTNDTIRLIHKFWKPINDLLTLRSDIEFIVRPIKGSTNGRTFGIKGVVEIDPRNIERIDRGPKRVLETICHELVHIEQYATGRLKKESGATFWKDKCVRHSKTQSYKEYLNLPWEIEAREVAAMMVELLMPTEKKEL